MELVATKKFKRQLKKTIKNNPRYAILIKNKLRLLRNNPSHPSLRRHKIDSDTYSISIDMSMRITFLWQDDTVIFLEVGSHDEVY
jgi:toxin HigB-1